MKPNSFYLTEQDQHAEELQMLQTAVETAANGIAITDVRGTLQWVNQAFSRLTGYSREEVVGQNHRVLKSGCHPPEFYRTMWETIQRGEPWHGQMINRRKDGTFYHEEMTITPVRAKNGGITSFVAIKQDISERILNEEKIRRLNHDLESQVIERTAELMSTVNALRFEIAERQRLEVEVLKISDREQSRIGRDLHDGVCQNLAGIAIFAEVAARELDREQHRLVPNIREISELARQSADDLRRLAAGLYPLKIEQHGLVTALQELASETSARSPAACTFSMRQSLILTDQNAAVQLYRIAQEAVSNAVRHANPAHLAIELSESGGIASLVIRDDGCGLSPCPEKSGMGLHTMQYRAKMLGGSLDVRPADGGGTLVTCSFPGKDFFYAKEHTNS